MDSKSKYEYDAYIKERVISRSMIETAKFEGREEGMEQGREQGIEQGREEGIYLSQVKTTKELHKKGLDVGFNSAITGLQEDEVDKIIKNLIL